ncbi:hypothetical protein CEXT_52181 [Caerostris extrusa]|uniref:Maturase K n=1 Tax=Caerostris extrusa TaxID=172846 RepID=A0AAV4RET3_CAEEX|nr:hypothetical protein CEXT_52181 [Caerostris extrusa]
MDPMTYEEFDACYRYVACEAALIERFSPRSVLIEDLVPHLVLVKRFSPHPVLIKDSKFLLKIQSSFSFY